MTTSKRLVVNYTYIFLPFLFNSSIVKYWHELVCVYGEVTGMEIKGTSKCKHPGHKSPSAPKAWSQGYLAFFRYDSGSSHASSHQSGGKCWTVIQMMPVYYCILRRCPLLVLAGLRQLKYCAESQQPLL